MAGAVVNRPPGDASFPRRAFAAGGRDVDLVVARGPVARGPPVGGRRVELERQERVAPAEALVEVRGVRPDLVRREQDANQIADAIGQKQYYALAAHDGRERIDTG